MKKSLAHLALRGWSLLRDGRARPCSSAGDAGAVVRRRRHRRRDSAERARPLRGVGGVIAPFVGYKLFDDKDLQLNPGIVGSGRSSSACRMPDRVHGTPDRTGNATVSSSTTTTRPMRSAITVGPRVSLPIGPMELYGDWQVGGLTGLNSASASPTRRGASRPAAASTVQLQRERRHRRSSVAGSATTSACTASATFAIATAGLERA